MASQGEIHIWKWVVIRERGGLIGRVGVPETLGYYWTY